MFPNLSICWRVILEILFSTKWMSLVINPLDTPQTQPSIHYNPLTSHLSSRNPLLSPSSSLSPISNSSVQSFPSSLASDSLLDISQNLADLQNELSQMRQSVVQLQEQNTILRRENQFLKTKNERSTLQCRSLLSSLEHQNARNALLVEETQRLTALYSPPEPLYTGTSPTPQSDTKFEAMHTSFIFHIICQAISFMWSIPFSHPAEIVSRNVVAFQLGSH